jgi:hypothetical protein
VSDELLVPERSKAIRARQLFLRALQQRVPQVSQTLRLEVLSLYTAVPKVVKADCSRGPTVQSVPGEFEKEPDLVLWNNVEFHAEQTPEVRRMRDGLLQWSERFHLTSEWLLNAALYTLCQWDRYPIETLKLIYRDGDPDRLRSLPVDGGLLCPFTLEEREFRLHDGGWEAGYESWTAFQKRIRTAFKASLVGYEKRLKRLAENRKYTEPPEIRNQQQFDWLALYQSSFLSPKDIKKLLERETPPHHTEENTIFKAVEKTADLIGLTLRPSQRGNRRSRKT